MFRLARALTVSYAEMLAQIKFLKLNCRGKIVPRRNGKTKEQI